MGYLLLKDSETMFSDLRPENTSGTLCFPSGRAVMLLLGAELPKLSALFSKEKQEL